MPSYFSSIYKQSFLGLTEFSHSYSFGVGQGTVWHGHVVWGRRSRGFLQATDFSDQFFFIGSGGSGNLGGGQRRVQPFFQDLSGLRDRGKVHGGVSGFLLQPIFVSAGQGQIRPVKELAFLLGTAEVQPIGVLVRTTLIQGGRFATETQQMFPHLEKV